MNIHDKYIPTVVVDIERLVPCCCSGHIQYADMYEMLRNMEPPVGFGKKCPYRLAYRVSSGDPFFTTNSFLIPGDCTEVLD